AREQFRAGVLTEREAWAMVHGVATSGNNLATAITLTAGLTAGTEWWPQMGDRWLVGSAVEEAVRLGNPFAVAARTALTEFEVPGDDGPLAVHRGDTVQLWLTAANRDPRRPSGFVSLGDSADQHGFDPLRSRRPHLGWGAGYHLCAGVHVARELVTRAVVALREQCPDLAVNDGWERYAATDDGFHAAPVSGGP
ncbi:MAG: hypothetical protein ACRCZP_18010, partial [Phycicoccus sp.]